jgi:hypothetical protein
MNTDRAIILARKIVVYADPNKTPMLESARIALSDAVKLFDEGDFRYAKKRAADAVSYVEGVHSENWAKISA